MDVLHNCAGPSTLDTTIISPLLVAIHNFSEHHPAWVAGPKDSEPVSRPRTQQPTSQPTSCLGTATHGASHVTTMTAAGLTMLALSSGAGFERESETTPTPQFPRFRNFVRGRIF